MVEAVEIGARLRVRLQGWGRLGEALAQHDDLPIFVFGGIDGEEVEVEVVRRHRRYLAARVVHVLEPSPHRIKPPCPHFGACTGCQWQHISEQHQRELKREAVVDALERIGGLRDPPVADILPAPAPFSYRNHARFTIGPQGALGYVNRESRRFVPIDRCMLMDEGINTTLGQLQGNCAETTQLSVRYGTGTGDVLVQPTLRNPDVPLATGQKHFRELMGGHVFRVASPSFFQVNTQQAERMVQILRDELKLTGDEVVADVYAGVGTFAVLLAPYCKQVIAIEESSAAMDDAQVNCEGIPNLELCHARAEDALASMERCPDAIVLDPPRAGCHPSMLESLVRLRAAESRVRLVRPVHPSERPQGTVRWWLRTAEGAAHRYVPADPPCGVRSHIGRDWCGQRERFRNADAGFRLPATARTAGRPRHAFPSAALLGA